MCSYQNRYGKLDNIAYGWYTLGSTCCHHWWHLQLRMYVMMIQLNSLLF